MDYIETDHNGIEYVMPDTSGAIATDRVVIQREIESLQGYCQRVMHKCAVDYIHDLYRRHYIRASERKANGTNT